MIRLHRTESGDYEIVLPLHEALALAQCLAWALERLKHERGPWVTYPRRFVEEVKRAHRQALDLGEEKWSSELD